VERRGCGIVRAAHRFCRGPGWVHSPFSLKIFRLAVSGAVLLAGTLGMLQLWPSVEARINEGLSKTEVVGLIERDFAYWLAMHVGSAGGWHWPPNVTTTLYYYGESADWDLWLENATVSRPRSASRAPRPLRRPRN